jgi:large subunit ribosomal protein L6e
MAPKAKKSGPRKPRNEELVPGLYRFSKARMFQKRGVAKKKPFAKAKKIAKKAVEFVTKKIGGDKNGKERRVPKTKVAKLEAEVRPNRRVRRKRAPTKQKLRGSIKPGSVLIVLAGRHKGKRVVFLKQLASGLLLITGPLKLNNCPLRRIAQAYVIATATSVDVSGVKVPAHIDDAYFRRARKSKRAPKGEETDIFASTKTVYTVSDQRKADQKSVDGSILAAIKKSPEKRALYSYIGSTFHLAKGQFPHNLKF